MAVAGRLNDGLDSLERLWSDRSSGRRARATIAGIVIALGIHSAVGAGLSTLDLSALFRRDRAVEVEINEPPPPPPEVKPEPPPPPPPPEPVRPKIVMRRAPAPPPPEAPPPPSAEPPKAEAPPVFGVSMDSTVSGDGPGMAVPIGNTLMTKERSRPKPTEPVRPLGGTGDSNGLPVPVPEMFVSEPPKLIKEIKGDDLYPPEARRMGIEGRVDAKLLIDENGDVRQVKVIKPAGHGFDEVAKQALKQFKFSPARTADGKAVPYSLTWRYTFELPPQ